MSKQENVIPDAVAERDYGVQNEAVEVAARTWFERATGCDWDDESENTKRGHRGDMRAGLEAAIAHRGILADPSWLKQIRAEAWEEGYASGEGVMAQLMSPTHFATEADNPYGSVPNA